jgi:hypothetical protein
MLTRLLLLFLAFAAHAEDGDDPLGALENNASGFIQATPGIAPTPAAAAAGPVLATCGHITTGQFALVDFPYPNSSPTGVPARYRLSRPSDKLYVAEVNVHYKAAEGYDGPWPPEQVNEKYQDRLAACLAEHGEVFKDPATGVRLELHVTKDAQVPVQLVEIGNHLERSNSKRYQSNAGCALMLHESLHLVGLVDEYPEKAKSLEAQLVKVEIKGGQRTVTTKKVQVPPPDCRALGPNTSVMYRQAWALSSVAMKHFTATKCDCEKGYDCRKVALTAGNATNCPYGTKPREVSLELYDGDKIETKATQGEFTLTATAKAAQVADPISNHASLLFPAHFRAITEPGCQNSNAVYYACAKNAYRFTALPEALKGLPIPDVGCLPKPPECVDGNFDWLK